MTPAHAHLILNHVPILGALGGFLLLAWGAWRASDEVRRVGMVALVLTALVGLAVFFTGEPAEDAVKHLPGVAQRAIETHEGSARISLALIELSGIAALAGLLWSRQGPPPRWLASAMLVLSLVTAIQIGWTGHLGGMIHHQEIRAGGQGAHQENAENSEAKESEERR